MKRSLVVLVTVFTVLLFGSFSCGKPVPGEDLAGTVWILEEIALSGIRYDDLMEQYVLEFGEDNTLTFYFEVNVLQGKWEADPEGHDFHLYDVCVTEVCCDGEKAATVREVMFQSRRYSLEADRLRIESSMASLVFIRGSDTG